MVKSTLNQYAPDYAIHPGEILEETLEIRKIKKNELAERAGLSPKTVSQIINCKAPITSETAIHFERVLGVSATVWNNLDANFRLFSAKFQEQQRLKERIEWAKQFPIYELKKRKTIPKDSKNIELVKNLLDFFGVASPKIWGSYYRNLATSFRKSTAYKTSFESVTTWLRIGYNRAENIETSPYDKNSFFVNLQKIRKLTVESPNKFEPKMKDLCKKSGVALIFVSEFPNTHIYGATRWINKDKALLMLTLHYKTNDHLWFSFFHEAGHILYHGKKMLFIDEKDTTHNEMEDHANQFSRNILMPLKAYETFVDNGSFYPADIKRFAKSINIAPGIVVGFLQHDKHIPFRWHNGLKEKFKLID